MKTKAILATLFVAAAASAEARFAPPFPRKAVPPDESGYWIVINDNPWSHDVEFELATASRSPTGPDRRKIIANKGRMSQNAERSHWCRAQQSRRSFHAL